MSVCDGCSEDMVYACSHEYGTGMPPCANKALVSPTTAPQCRVVTLDEFRAQWIARRDPENDGCDCAAYSRALWDAARESVDVKGIIRIEHNRGYQDGYRDAICQIKTQTPGPD